MTGLEQSRSEVSSKKNDVGSSVLRVRLVIFFFKGAKYHL